MHLDEEWELKKKRKEFEWFTKTTEYSFCHFWLIGMLSYQIMLGDVLEKFTHGGNQERNKTALAVVANKKKHRIILVSGSYRYLKPVALLILYQVK